MNIRDKIHPSKQPVGATHYNEDWHCSETEGIQYFKVAADAYHFWSGGRWVIGNTPMPARTIIPLPNLQIETYAAAPHVNCNFASLTKDLKPADPADELGKVWDVLHAAGINSGGELSASEGVKLLADKAKWAVPPFPKSPSLHTNVPKPAHIHDWMYVESLNKMCCTKCEATRSAT